MVMSKAEEKKRQTTKGRPKKAKNIKKKQGLRARLDEAEGKKKGKKNKKQGLGARLDEAEPRRRTAGRRRNYGGMKK